MKTVAIMGNPNSGKTTLFNLLTKSREKVGNRTGVTVEKKEKFLHGKKGIKIVDLPGTYSLSPKSKDELAVLNYLKTSSLDLIVYVIDGLNLRKSLLLFASLSRLTIPLILAVNKVDEMEKQGINLDVEQAEKLLGVKIVFMSATKNKGVKELKELFFKDERQFLPNKNSVFFGNVSENKEEDFAIIKDLSEKILIKKEVKVKRANFDKLFMHPHLGIPTFALVIFSVYFLSFKVGGYFGKNISEFLFVVIDNLSAYFSEIRISVWVIGLVYSVFSGVISVISFLPQVTVLFFLISFLEQSGYLSRVSYLLDGIFCKFNMSGKTAVPLILSCGCTVTGVMSCRFIESETERKRAVLISSFLPCSAKAAVFGWFSQTFFGGSALVAASCYFLGIAVAVAIAKITALKDKTADKNSFILEIPPLKLPEIKDVFNAAREKATDFLLKAGSVILTVSFVLWGLKSFGFLGYTEKVEESFLFFLGNGLKYLFIPLGFGGYEESVALIFGIFAKESVIASLTLTGVTFTNGFSAYAFMSFILLSPPCAGALSVMKRELKGKREFFRTLFIQFFTGYAVALSINFTGKLLSYNKRLILFLFAGIIILLFVTFAKKTRKGVKS